MNNALGVDIRFASIGNELQLLVPPEIGTHLKPRLPSIGRYAEAQKSQLVDHASSLKAEQYLRSPSTR